MTLIPNSEEQRSAAVLVVDDMAENRKLLERWLIGRGCTVETAENGRVALEKVGHGVFDLILLDLEMPELDGYATLSQLKAGSATREIPVIMISGVTDLPQVARCIKAGAEDYLPKPFEPVLLAARVDASLERKRLRDAEVQYLAQVKRVTEAARALEARHYEPGFLGDVAVRKDELGQLARVFDSMAVQVADREARLQERLDALRAEITADAQSSADPTAAPTQRISSTGEGGAAHDLGLTLEHGAIFAGRFEIVSELGRGGMGVVYRARDIDLDEPAAIKLLPPQVAAENESALERFKSEIRLARQVSSPHVIRTHDFGVWNGIPYLTMEFVPGITLRELLKRRGTMAPAAVLGFASQLVRGLDAAHAKNVIHRDIKPENILLDEAGVLKIMDFGVALMVERVGLMTKAGAIIGTPAYMSPEQLVGDPVDVRTDIFSTGVVLYECLTGRRPVDADNIFQLVARMLELDPEPPATLVPEIPKAVSELVLRLIAKAREDRPGSMKEVAELLAAVA